MNQNYIEYSTNYYKKREYSRTFRAEVNAIVNALEPSLQDRILELGCGSGVILNLLGETKTARLVGLDWLITSMELTSRRVQPSADLVRGDATCLPFPNNSFDKLYAQHLIEHFEDTIAILSEWRRVLRRGGKMVIVTPNRFFPHQEWFDDPTHRHIFTIKELSECARKAGFIVEHARIINPYFLHWRLTGFVAEHLQWLRYLPVVGKKGMGIMLIASNPQN